MFVELRRGSQHKKVREPLTLLEIHPLCGANYLFFQFCISTTYEKV